jgi:hypothetical protein
MMSDSSDGVRHQFRMKPCRFLDTAAGTHVTPATNSHGCHMTRTSGSSQCLMFAPLRGVAAVEGVFFSTAKNPLQTPNKSA